MCEPRNDAMAHIQPPVDPTNQNVILTLVSCVNLSAEDHRCMVIAFQWAQFRIASITVVGRLVFTSPFLSCSTAPSLADPKKAAHTKTVNFIQLPPLFIPSE